MINLRRTFLLIFLLVLACTAFKCGEGEQITTVPDNLPISVTTPHGVKIRSVVPVPMQAQTAIETGILTQIQKTSAFYDGGSNGGPWTQKRSLADYRVIFIDPQATNMDGTPAVMVRGIRSAGTVRGVGDDGWSEDSLILPHQADTNWRYLDYLRDAARFESEHDAEWANDKRVFYYFSQPGKDVHPHFP